MDKDDLKQSHQIGYLKMQTRLLQRRIESLEHMQEVGFIYVSLLSVGLLIAIALVGIL